MTEIDDAVADLKVFKQMLVAARRRLVAAGVRGNKNAPRAPGAPYEIAVGPNTSRSGEVRALQDDIDAVNRAIRDEEDSRAPGSAAVAPDDTEVAN